MRKVTLQPSGHDFQVEEGESILTAALRQASSCPTAAATAPAAPARARSLEGQVDYGVYQKKALTDEEKAQG